MDAFGTNITSTFNGNSFDRIQQQHTQQRANNNTNVAAVVNAMQTHMPSSGSVAGYAAIHATVSREVDPYDEKSLNEICKTLLMLEDIKHGRHIVNWKELIDPSQPMESAKNISAALARPTTLPNAFQAVADLITTPAHLSIVACLETPYRVKVRDAVLQDLLNTLTMERTSNPMPLCSEMLAEMVRLNLVVLRGVEMTLKTLLKDKNTRRAAVAVLGKLADQNRGDEAFSLAVRNVEPLLQAIREPEYDYDCLIISRLLGWGSADRAAVSLVPVKKIEQLCPVTSMAYFRQRDELVSATCDGSVVFWGSPHPTTGEVKAAVTREIPRPRVPVAMDGPPRGNYMVVACVPFPMSNLQAMMGENGYTSINSGNASSNSVKKWNLSAPVSKVSLLRLMTLSDSTGTWVNGETISRKENVILTGVAAMTNFVVCAAESTPSEKSFEAGMQHDLVLINGHNAQALRRFERVHDDYITVVRVGDDSDHILLSGSRDCVVKAWDTRSGTNRAGLTTAASIASATPTQRLKHNHTDTITAVLPHGKALLTASLDGSLLVWDARRMNEPVHEVHVAAPIIDVALADGGHVAVSTARGLHLLSLDTLKAQDIISNVAYTQLKSNNDHSVIFAAGASGISIYAVRG